MLKKYIQFNSFCLQVDDWMLLEITEKIVGENAFWTKEKETRVKFNPGLEQFSLDCRKTKTKVNTLANQRA